MLPAIYGPEESSQGAQFFFHYALYDPADLPPGSRKIINFLSYISIYKQYSNMSQTIFCPQERRHPGDGPVRGKGGRQHPRWKCE